MISEESGPVVQLRYIPMRAMVELCSYATVSIICWPKGGGRPLPLVLQATAGGGEDLYVSLSVQVANVVLGNTNVPCNSLMLTP